MDTHIDDTWYATDDSAILRYVKQIATIQEQTQTELKEIKDDVKQMKRLLEQALVLQKSNQDEIAMLKQQHKELELKKINDSLHELRVLREREVNALLREHIPFRFVRNSPLFRRPFSSYQKNDSFDP
jgi:hypothetical protein